MKLDRAALDHLLSVAKDLGYRTVKLETVEDYLYEPKIAITFTQTRESEPPPNQMVPVVPITLGAKDVRDGVTEDQAAEIAGKGNDKMRTLDD